MEEFEYSKPQVVTEPDDCFFYHKQNLPVAGEVGASWDLRSCIDDYLGRCDFSGQRVLDVGTASGYLTFEMEKRGADVVSFDMPSSQDWNTVPHHRVNPEQYKVNGALMRDKTHRQMQKAYWFAHHQLKSSARAWYGNIYDLPVQLGNFDIVVMGMIVSHVRDPFQAIYSAGRLSRDLIVVTNQVPKLSWWKRIRGKKPQANFIPSATDLVTDAWWFLPPRTIERMLGTIGFEVVRQVESYPDCLFNNRTGSERCVSIVAKRFGGTPAGIDSDSQRLRLKAA